MNRGLILGRGGEFSLLHRIQTVSGAHTGSYSVFIGVPFADWGVTLNMSFHIVMRLRRREPLPQPQTPSCYA